ncbi:MAG: hypothetical protein J4F32_06485 [Dehalococcoidia bacterium]|nr:hypothetical protein [Dehalococcoidia bacterium]
MRSPPLHHSEPVDPTLLDWILHQVDRLLPFDPVVGVAIGGVLLLAAPAVLAALAVRHARRRAGRA